MCSFSTGRPHMCLWSIIAVSRWTESRRVVNKALKNCIIILLTTWSEYLNEATWNVNWCICGIFFTFMGCLKHLLLAKLLLTGKKVILWQKNSIDFVRLMSTVINHKPIVWSVCNFSPDFLCLLFTGILVAKKNLFVNPVPSGCGGGSVFFVSAKSF